jgi:hypothetical protein
VVWGAERGAGGAAGWFVLPATSACWERFDYRMEVVAEMVIRPRVPKLVHVRFSPDWVTALVAIEVGKAVAHARCRPVFDVLATGFARFVVRVRTLGLDV